MRVPPETAALTIFRILKNGEPRRYSATTFPSDPLHGCDQMVRMALATGAISSTPHVAGQPPGYGVLDVLDAQGDIIADFEIPNAAGFRFLKRKLNIVVEEIDPDPEPPVVG